MPGNINEDTWKRAKDAVKRKPDEDENSYKAIAKKTPSTCGWDELAK